jgi:hypothetical protein
VETYQPLLRKISYIGLAFSILDIAYFLYSRSDGWNYEPVWGAGALAIALFLLFKGNLQATGWVGDDALLLLIIITSFFTSTLITRPLSLWIVHFRLYPIHAIYFFVFHIFLIAALGWIYRRLRSAEMVETRQAAGMITKFPKVWVGLVIGFLITFLLASYINLNGGKAREAKQLAHEQLGDQYSYHVTGIEFAGNNLNAKVTAYSENEIHYLTIRLNLD